MKASVFCTTILFALWPLPTTALAAEKPNILVILSDDQGYADAGFQGSKEVPTPNLDRLASEGVRCTSGYVTHPYCSPSRAGLLTGRCQMRFGHERNPYYDPANHREGLPLTEKLLPEYLSAAGYATGWIGKWHLGAAPEFRPEKRGFQETFGFLGGGHQYQNWKVNPAREYTVPICRNGQPVEVKEHLTLAFGHEAGAFVKRHRGQPWFLYLAFNAPHTPHQPTAERLAKFAHIRNKQRAAYLAQISLMDDAVGETLTALRETGQDKRTLVFFFSDNGGPTYVGASNGPLRGCKGTTYEGGVRVPFVVSWPGHLPGGKDFPAAVSSLDVFPTALACAGVPMPADKPHDGVDLLPFLAGARPGPPHERLCWREEEQGQWGLRDGAMKFVRRTHNVSTARGEYKVVPLGRPAEELYDLARDIGEAADLAPQQPARLKELGAAMDEWTKQAAPLAFTGIKGREPEPAGPRAPAPIPRPTPQQAAWQDLDFGVLFSFDQRIYESRRAEYPTPAKVMADPRAYAELLKPKKLDTDQWVAAAKALGANHAILVVKHWLGFCLWQSDANPYSLKSISWRDGKADILRDFVASCKKYGLKPGVFTEARWDVPLGVVDFKVGPKSPVTQAEYNRLLERELEELCTRYGELCEFWYDVGSGPCSDTFREIISKHQPTAVFYGPDYRWGGTETGMQAYPCWSTLDRNGDLSSKRRLSGDPAGQDWFPARADVPLRCERGRHDWYWHPGGEAGVASLEHLKKIYYGSVGRNAKVVIGLTPNRDGLLDPTDVTRCQEFGDWLRRTLGGKPLAETSGKGNELTLEFPAGNKTPVTHIILEEDIKDGERVREYVVEAEVDGAWQQVAAGSCIGHKRIEKIVPCAARAYRLRVTQSVAEPRIRSFQLR